MSRRASYEKLAERLLKKPARPRPPKLPRNLRKADDALLKEALDFWIARFDQITNGATAFAEADRSIEAMNMIELLRTEINRRGAETSLAGARFGKRLRALRESRGWSQAALAEKVDVSQPFIAQLERDTKQPSWDTVQALAAALEIATDEFRRS